MSRTRNRFVIATFAVAGVTSAALALSPIAAADPATEPAVPTVPGLDIVQQVATDALAPQGAPLPVPIDTAAVSVPLPAAVSAPSPAAISSPEPQLIPSADISIPQVPGMPVPLPSELSFPGDLLSLLPAGLPNPLAAVTGASAPAAATAPVAAVAPIATAPIGLPVFPTAGLP
ncbi:MAG: hypothetical protein ACSLE6_09615 [Mycobacterium sp.]